MTPYSLGGDTYWYLKMVDYEASNCIILCMSFRPSGGRHELSSFT
jgi:hypothetical protein